MERERIWIATNLVEALADVLSGTKASKIRISIDLNSESYAIAIYDYKNQCIYHDFASMSFPSNLLSDVGFNEDERNALHQKWRISLRKLYNSNKGLLLQPLNKVDLSYLDFMSRVIRNAFPQFIVAIETPKPVPTSFLEASNSQYRADSVLSWLKSLKGKWDFVLGIIPEDICIPGMDCPFLIHDKPAFARVAILSLGMLGYPSERRSLIEERLKKQTLHIVGHFLGLPDCKNDYCVMSEAESLEDLDSKSSSFCLRCLARLLPGRYIQSEG